MSDTTTINCNTRLTHIAIATFWITQRIFSFSDKSFQTSIYKQRQKKKTEMEKKKKKTNAPPKVCGEIQRRDACSYALTFRGALYKCEGISDTSENACLKPTVGEIFVALMSNTNATNHKTTTRLRANRAIPIALAKEDNISRIRRSVELSP